MDKRPKRVMGRRPNTRSLSILLLLASLVLVLSGCVSGRDVFVTNPCGHPVELKFSADGVSTPDERDWRVADGSPVRITVVAPGGTEHVGGVHDAGGYDTGFILWYDASGYQRQLTFGEADESDAPIVLPTSVCARA